MLNKESKRVHCIGIGGIGVSGIAELLLAKGFSVSGSDFEVNENTRRLQALGVKVLQGHCPENVTGADCVIYTSAVMKDNLEYLRALEMGIPVISRGEALADFVNSYTTLAVAGTHGKTTTTGLVAHLLQESGCDASYAIGGLISNRASPIHLGLSDLFVAEADESDGSFMFMQPTYAVVTNIDVDHLEAYGGDFMALRQSFLGFLRKIPAHGAAYVCVDDPVVAELVPSLPSNVVTYGFSKKAQIRASNYRQRGLVSQFDVTLRAKETVAMSLSIPGKHNVQNALAACAVADKMQIELDKIRQALRNFPGVERRFHRHGLMRVACGQAMIIEDYGHHPQEIKATLEAARTAWPGKRIVCVFQPHRYSRTKDLYQKFIEVLIEADKLYLLDVYSAGESLVKGATSVELLDGITKKSSSIPEYVSNIELLPRVLFAGLQDDDVVILQGAGSIGSVAQRLFEKHG